MLRTSRLLPLVALVCIVGCSTPMEKAHTVSSMYAQGQQDLIQQRTLKLISDSDYEVFAKADEEITPLLREMNRSAIEAETESVPWSKTFAFNQFYDKARAKVNEFLLKLATMKRDADKK